MFSSIQQKKRRKNRKTLFSDVSLWQIDSNTYEYKSVTFHIKNSHFKFTIFVFWLNILMCIFTTIHIIQIDFLFSFFPAVLYILSSLNDDKGAEERIFHIQDIHNFLNLIFIGHIIGACIFILKL